MKTWRNFEWIPSIQQALDHHSKVGELLCGAREASNALGADIQVKLSSNDWELIHVEIAAAHSGTLCKLLEQRSPPFLIDLSQFKSVAVHKTISFMYTSRINVSLVQLPELLLVADFLQIMSLKQCLEDFLAIKSSELPLLLHCLNLACSTKSTISSRTRHIVLKHAVKYFEKVFYNPLFTELDSGVIESLISRKDLPVGNEMDIFYILLFYLHKSVDSRTADRLLQHIHYDKLTTDEKLEIEKSTMRLQNQTLCSIIRGFLADSSYSSSSKDQNEQIIARTGKSMYAQVLKNMKI